LKHNQSTFIPWNERKDKVTGRANVILNVVEHLISIVSGDNSFDLLMFVFLSVFSQSIKLF
jgi:hypothetical protein